MQTLSYVLMFFIGAMAGWALRNFSLKLGLALNLYSMSKIVESSCLTMLARSSEHYYQSLEMLRQAGEVTDRKGEVVSTINSLEYTHSEWKKTAIQTIYNVHPFKNLVKWYDWRTAMQELEKEKLITRRNQRNES